MKKQQKGQKSVSTKEKLLQAAITLIRTKGYSATTVDDLCQEANVTKGTFFHYFPNKEAFAIEASKHWSEMTGGLFESAPYHKLSDPLERFLGYINFRKEILQGKTQEFTCLVGTMVQEVYSTHPDLRNACRASIFGHAKTLEDDIKEAKKLYAPGASWSASGLALHTQAVLQGAFILAKASDDVDVASESITHLINYIKLLFGKETHHE